MEGRFIKKKKRKTFSLGGAISRRIEGGPWK